MAMLRSTVYPYHVELPFAAQTASQYPVRWCLFVIPAQAEGADTFSDLECSPI
jgi:hypothetical protein